MTVFILDSDKHFIRQNNHCTGIDVYEYSESTNSYRYSRVVGYYPRMNWLGHVSVLGFDHSWSGLEVFGFTFTGDSLDALVRDLTMTDEDGQKKYLLVNRQDLCFKEVVDTSSKRYVRVFGHFSWSKYGVVNPSRHMRNGAVSDCLAIMPA